jgi:hypothetical protein
MLAVGAWTRRVLRSAGGRRHPRQVDEEFRALAGDAGAERAHFAAVQVHQLLDEVQADAQASLRAAGHRGVLALDEQLEHARQGVGHDSGAVVAHAELGAAVGRAAEREHDAAARRREFRGVVEQVGEHLHQPHRVAEDVQGLGRRIDDEVVAALGHRRLYRGDGVVEHLLEAGDFLDQVDLARGDAAHVEQVVDQAPQVRHLPREDVARGTQARIARLLELHDRHRVRDGRHRVAQLVAEQRQEFGEPALLFLERADAPARGQVARHLHEPLVAAFAVVDRGDHHVRPEPAAVLAQAPALVLEPALSERDVEFVPRPVDVELLLRVEDREVPADDLGGVVALVELRALVPAGDVAVHVEHEDRVVAHALHHQAEAFLALAQAFERVVARAAVPAIAADRTAVVPGAHAQGSRRTMLASRSGPVLTMAMGQPASSSSARR